MVYALLKKVDVYDTFIEGTKESFSLIITIFPTMLAMIFGVNIFIKSGILNILLPNEVFSMMLLRPISGSATLAFLNNIYIKYGPDSFNGLLSSVIQGSTDTTFYVLTLYFGSIGIKKIRYALFAGLFADLVGIISALFIVKLFF